MQMRSVLLRLATVGAVAAVSLVPVAAQAQTANRGQLVQAVAKLHQAQLAFVKKLADDPSYAKQYEDAVTSGNYDAVSSLVALASGVSKSSISAGPRGSSANGASNAGAGNSMPVRYASLTGHEAAAKSMGGGFVCINLGIVYGCITFN